MKTIAISVPPSENWAGDDGLWSTFSVQIGDAPPVYLLPATSTSTVWVVDQQKACLSQVLTSDACAAARGHLFDFTASKTFVWAYGTQNDSLEYLPFNAEANLMGPYSDSGSLFYAGVDTVTFGASGESAPTLRNQFIIDYWATTPYVGLLGLWSNATTALINDEPVVYNSITQTLATDKNTSLYWAYTAGAHWRDQYPGSLTFGGYDAARGNPNQALMIPTLTGVPKDLLIGITQINVNRNVGQSEPIAFSYQLSAYIDSAVPEMWLPLDICNQFQQIFGLQYDNLLSRYLINDDQYQTMISQNATIDLTLAAPNSDSSDSVTISFSYQDFYQQLSSPLTLRNDALVYHYFPLRIANSTSQYTLGRVFLQEAYLAVDYDINKFYVSQAQFPADQHDTNIVAVQPSGKVIGKGGLTTGDIVGIVIGAVGALAIICGLLWWFVYRPRSKKRQQKLQQERQNQQMVSDHRDVIGFYGNTEKAGAYSSDEAYEKREMDASQPPRASVASRSELPSPPLPQYSPGSPGREWPDSRGSVEVVGDYLTYRRSTQPQSPVELSTDGEQRRGNPAYEIA